MAIYIVSYFQKKQKHIILFQCLATALFATSFAMLGAMTGMILNIISAIRAILFLYKKQLKTDNNIWLIGFFATYAATYVLAFTVFQKEFTVTNAIIELLPIIGMVATTFGYRAKTANGVRVGGIVNEPAWLIYDIITKNNGAVLANAFSICSIFLGFLREKKSRKPIKQ